ncbi:hypothetical protein IP92_04652 [Pseudoduganella flava]|nr:DUF6701 domain-containing protein [Pseudoduganella flava]TWI44133.1 hypothetical protein IP92_04652 [Pseudoduganella flava]
MMNQLTARLYAALLALVLGLAGQGARADTPIVLFKSFAGNINFTGTEATLRTSSNYWDPCATTSSVSMYLGGLPSGATVLAAYLYWAGSGSTPDYTVTFDGKSITAPAPRQFTSSTVGYNYFSGAADVTDQVKAKGNGYYSAGNLTIDRESYCAVSGVLGGFQLLVIYGQSKETFRVLNVYEGFQYIRYSSVELTLANFLTPSPIGTLTGRVGHITWEGDPTLSGGGETLRYNGVEQTDAYNDSGNQFNSVSNVNGDTASYGIDFDAYTVKSPIIAGGQSSAKTTYTSGQDLVLLNAEIIAAPNVPATDRGVTLTLNGALVPSAATTYTISVVNNGPMDEGGPLIVSGLLPASLIFGGATGTDWTCTVVSQRLTCTYSGTVKSNTTLPPITLTVTPAEGTAGMITFAVSVAGKLFDYYDGNNTSTVTARVGAQTFTPVFVFTDAQCVHNVPFGDPAQPCNPLSLDKWNANTDLRMWITFTAKGVPTALANSNTTLPMRFALSCVDPTTHAGVQATYNLRTTTLTLPLCASNGVIPDQTSTAWSGVNNILFPGGVPSSRAANAKAETDPTDFMLRYQDVGRIELFVTDNQARLGSTGSFVSRPTSLLLLAQSQNAARDPASATDPPFVAAGTPFTMTVRALMPGLTNAAPNFGRETDPVTIKVRVLPATTADGSPIDAMVADVATNQASTELAWGTKVAKTDNQFGAFAAGIATGTFYFDDIGVIKVNSSLEPKAGEKEGSYLGSGDVTGNSINVGRFYPSAFATIVTGTVTPCVTAAACPALATTPVSAIGTMAYAGQPFSVRVEARNAKGAKVNNYRLSLAQDVALSPWTQPNGSTQQVLPATSSFTNTAIAASVFTQGAATVSPTYAFPSNVMYKRTAPAANNWPQPVSVYVRAVETTGSDNVTSKRDAATVEGGVRIVAGRMLVPDMRASALQPLSVTIKPQMFGTLAGVAGWYDMDKDSSTTFTAANVKFEACKNLPGASGCNVVPVVDPATVGQITNGSGIVKLKAPGAGKTGIAPMYLDAPLWLPSTTGNLTFGTVTSPYTYLREIY